MSDSLEKEAEEEQGSLGRLWLVCHSVNPTPPNLCEIKGKNMCPQLATSEEEPVKNSEKEFTFYLDLACQLLRGVPAKMKGKLELLMSVSHVCMDFSILQEIFLILAPLYSQSLLHTSFTPASFSPSLKSFRSLFPSPPPSPLSLYFLLEILIFFPCLFSSSPRAPSRAVFLSLSLLCISARVSVGRTQKRTRSQGVRHG